MTCDACQAPLREPYRFCGRCGHQQAAPPAELHYFGPSGRTVLQLDAVVDRIAAAFDEDHYVWCDGWKDWKPWDTVSWVAKPVRRRQVELQESPEAVAEYSALVAQMASDGIIEDWEERVMQTRRTSLGISQDTHDRLVEEHLQEARPWLRAAVDAEAMAAFRTGYACMLRIQVHNLSSEGLASVKVEVSTSSSNGLVSVKAPRLGPGADEVVQLLLQPEVAGHHQLELLFAATDYHGTTRHFRSQALAFEVARTEGEQGHRVYNVDLSSLQVGKLGHIGGLEPSSGGLLDATRWVGVPLSPLTESESTRWASERRSPLLRTSADSGAVLPVAPIQGEPLACRGVLLRVMQHVSGSKRPVLRDLWCLNGDAFTMGRKASHADLEALVEPYYPPHEHPKNFELCGLISGCHLSFRLDRRGAEVCDEGSRNGTYVAEQRLVARLPVPIASGTPVRLASALTLVPEVLVGDDDEAHVLWVKRVSNMPSRGYLLAPGGVGIWPGDDPLLGPRSRDGRQASLLLEWHERGLVVRNLGLPGVVHHSLGQSAAIEPRARVALDHNDRIQLGDRWTLLVAEVLPLRPGQGA